MCTDGPLPAIDTNLCVGVWCVCETDVYLIPLHPMTFEFARGTLSLSTKPETKQQKSIRHHVVCVIFYLYTITTPEWFSYFIKNKTRKQRETIFCFSNLKTKQLIRNNNNNNKRIVRWKTIKNRTRQKVTHTHIHDQHKNQTKNKNQKNENKKEFQMAKGAAPLLEAGQQDLIRFSHSCEHRSKMCIYIYSRAIEENKTK